MKSRFFLKRKLAALLLLTGVFTMTQNNKIYAQVHFNWALSQGSNESDFVHGLVNDDQGHLFTMQTITDTADLDPGPGTEMFVPWDLETVVLTKWSDAGEYLWSAAFQTKGETGGYLMRAKDNKLYVELYYTDTLVYVHQNTTTTLSTDPGEHVALLTLDLEGQILKLDVFQTGFNFYLSYFNTLSTGGYLIGGTFGDSITLQTMTGDTTFYSHSGDGMIARFDADWKLVWIRVFASDAEDYFSTLYEANSKIYYSVGHADTMTIQTINGSQTFNAANGDNVIFGTMSLDGDILTAQPFGGDKDDDGVEGITSDADGNIYICGYFDGQVNFQHPDEPPVYFTSTNSSEGFASKYSPDGRLQWTRIVRNSEYGGMSNMVLHRNENLYITGGYNGHSDLDPGPDSLIMETTNWGDIYGMKLDLDGNLQWVYTFTGEDLEGITKQIISPDARIYYSGFAYDVFDGDPGPDEFLIPNRGGTDQFLISLTEENVITSTTEPDPFQIQLYPNPTSDVVYLQTITPMESIVVYAPDGKRINVNTDVENRSACLHTSLLQPGMYAVQVKTSNAFQTLKFLKL